MLPESRVERINNTFFTRRSRPNSLQMLGEDLVEDSAAEVRFSRERLNQLERKKLRRNARRWQEKKNEGIVRKKSPLRCGNKRSLRFSVFTPYFWVTCVPEKGCFINLTYKLEACFSRHLTFGPRDAHVKQTMEADSNKLASLIRICGFLMQTKAYLFWKKVQDYCYG